MSLKTRRRKMARQHPPERVKRLERSAVRSFKAWATAWLDRKSLLDELRKCDQPVSGRDILRMQEDYTPVESGRYAEAKASVQETAKGVLARLREHYDHVCASEAIKRLESFRAMYPPDMKTAGPE